MPCIRLKPGRMAYSKGKDIALIVLQAARVAFDLAVADLWELFAFFAFAGVAVVVVGGPNVLDVYDFHRLA